MSPMPPDRLVVPAAHTFTLRRLLVAHGGPVTHAFDELDRPLAQAGSEGSVALRLDDQWCTRVESLGVPELGHLAGRLSEVGGQGCRHRWEVARRLQVVVDLCVGAALPPGPAVLREPKCVSAVRVLAAKTQ